MPHARTRVNDMFCTVTHADVHGCDTKNRMRPTPTLLSIGLPSKNRAPRASMFPLLILLHDPHYGRCDKTRVSGECSRNIKQGLR